MVEKPEGLKSGALGAFAVAALGSVMMAPALGIYANLGLISASAGMTAPSVFLVSLLLTLPTALSYAMIAREIPSAGSAYSWLSEAINPLVGTWVGVLLLGMYLFCVILQPIIFGVFFNELLTSLFHAPTSYGIWIVGVVVSTLLVALLAYPGIEIAAKSSLILTIFEALVVLALSATILAVHFSKGTVQLAPFNPAETLNGRHGFFGGLVFGLLSFVGFGVIATAAEETHSPKAIIPRAMVISCLILGAFWALTSWSFSLVLAPKEWSELVTRGVNPVAVIARDYWGAGSILVILTALTAVLGVYIASIIGYGRVAYAMSRDGALPSFMARLHPKYKVPWNAQHVAFIITLVIAAIWGKWLGQYLAYDWWGSAVVFFSMVCNILVSIGCLTFFYRFHRLQFNWSLHAFVPILGAASSLIPLYYSYGPSLWQSGWKKGQSIIVFCISFIIFSVLCTAILRVSRPEVLQRPSTGV